MTEEQYSDRLNKYDILLLISLKLHRFIKGPKVYQLSLYIIHHFKTGAPQQRRDLLTHIIHKYGQVRRKTLFVSTH